MDTFLTHHQIDVLEHLASKRESPMDILIDDLSNAIQNLYGKSLSEFVEPMKPQIVVDGDIWYPDSVKQNDSL